MSLTEALQERARETNCYQVLVIRPDGLKGKVELAADLWPEPVARHEMWQLLDDGFRDWDEADPAQ